MVEHECVGNESISVDLSNYKLINIEEGNNEYSLKESNLDTLVEEIKETHNGDLNELKNVKTSTFTKKNLLKLLFLK